MPLRHTDERPVHACRRCTSPRKCPCLRGATVQPVNLTWPSPLRAKKCPYWAPLTHPGVSHTSSPTLISDIRLVPRPGLRGLRRTGTANGTLRVFLRSGRRRTAGPGRRATFIADGALARTSFSGSTVCLFRCCHLTPFSESQPLAAAGDETADGPASRHIVRTTPRASQVMTRQGSQRAGQTQIKTTSPARIKTSIKTRHQGNCDCCPRKLCARASVLTPGRGAGAGG